MNREQWLLKRCNETLSLVMLHERTKDSFGKGQDMEMHYGEMCSLLVSLCTPTELEQHHWVNVNKEGLEEESFKTPSTDTRKHQFTNANTKSSLTNNFIKEQ